MRHSIPRLLLGFSLSLPILIGCGGSKSGPAAPAVDMDELQQYLAENPEQNVDGLEDLDEEGDFDAGRGN